MVKSSYTVKITRKNHKGDANLRKINIILFKIRVAQAVEIMVLNVVCTSILYTVSKVYFFRAK